MFKFKEFDIRQVRSSMKVNTDGILLGAWVDVNCHAKILDVGSGNGLISLMMAQRCPSCNIIGVEIDEGAFLDATDNASNSRFCNRVDFIQSSIQDYAENSEHLFDHIVSNPPFFTGGTFSSNENKMNVRHTVKLPHNELLRSVKKLLLPEGTFSVILPLIEGLRFIELAERSTLCLHKKCEVFTRLNSKVERLLLTFSSKRVAECVKESLVIHDGHTNEYSDAYKKLTKAFYLNM